MKVYQIIFSLLLPMILLGGSVDAKSTIEDDGSTFAVTFQLDMNEYSGSFAMVNVSGLFNEWCGICAPMTDDDSDGVYELVIDLDPGEHQFKYQVDEWTDQESLIPGSECTFTSGEFTNRIITVTSDMVLPLVCWESCVDCDNNINSYDVTFQLDMSEYTGVFTTVNLNGLFNGWCGGCTAMTDGDGDDVYEVMVTLQEGTTEFKFTLDGWGVQESLNTGDPCTISLDGFTNRLLEVTQNETLPVVCWESCAACGEDVITHDVTFKVDMSEYEESFTQVNLNGLFNEWCGECAVMLDDDGDDIYELTVTLPEGPTEYKFTLDGWDTEEMLTEGTSCTVTTKGFTNRYLDVTAEETLDAVCWELCEACIVNIDEVNAQALVSIYPNPSNGEFQLDLGGLNTSNAVLNVFSSEGKLVYSEKLSANLTQLDLTDLSKGMYQVQVIGSDFSIQKSVLLFN